MHTMSVCYRPSDNRVRSWCRHYSTGNRSRTSALSHRQREWGCNAAPDGRDDFSRRPESNICNPPYPRSVSLPHPAWVRQWCGAVHRGTWGRELVVWLRYSPWLALNRMFDLEPCGWPWKLCHWPYMIMTENHMVEVDDVMVIWRVNP